MVKWKILGARGEVNADGHFRPILLSEDENEVNDTDREGAYDALDTWATMLQSTLRKGMGLILTLEEYETFAEKEGKKLVTMLIIRGYREAGKGEDGEIRYVEDADDSDHQPTYTRYEKTYYRCEEVEFNMNFDTHGNITDDNGEDD